ncbi:phage tail assembly chaperone [Sphingorhabdus sp. Alg231-15]|uniref:phage tail assembly chaperone n=1 Tax=Sphingorhabdus sp. Alg231-15 TaxID=1922222 RepID=UPI000D54DC8E
MTKDFRASAAHCAGIVPTVLGWTPDQYWSATPAELTAILYVVSAASPGSQTAEPLSRTQLEKLKETFSYG